MTERPKIQRSITPTEATVIRRTIERAATSTYSNDLLAIIDRLEVTSRCDCGCDSIDFAFLGPQPPAQIIADGIGETAQGGKVGIIIWATPTTVTCLEIYDLGAGANDLKLPKLESIAPWGPEAPNKSA